MSFAVESDLLKYMPDALNFGVTNWDEALADAEADVKKLIKSRWFDREMGVRPKGQRLGITTSVWDPQRLDDTQWTKATVYRAISEYIMPVLSNFRPEGDAFREQIEFYEEKFEKEFNLELEFGVRYDMDNDDTFSDSEKFEVDTGRLYR